MVPDDTPVNTPFTEPITAMPILELDQMPPGEELEKVVFCPIHPFVEPEIGETEIKIDIGAVLKHAPNEYVIFAVPAASPVIKPVVGLTLATPVLLLLQIPPVVVLLSAVVAPRHTLVSPVMFAGIGFTVTMVVAVQVPTV